MKINEIEKFKMSDATVLHDKLNPAIWDNNKLIPEVRKQLMVIAKDFVKSLGVGTLHVKDVTIFGSNAAYSYTPHSDLDLHVVVDMSKLPEDKIYRELFTAKKTLYNDAHDITVHDVPVELYVQDSNDPVESLGEYSVLRDKWIKIPKKVRANFDEKATQAKYENLGNLIELALNSGSYDRVQKVIDTLKRYRQAGLSRGGEFSPENLAYKALRSQGYITKLYDLKNELHGKELSIEDYDPNATPPGPEFKPTMPKGTVRVDVSDVYDWYKLGQHISNLKGLGKHDFGKGPPSTILSFGDEDTEHKYIQDLEKTGLSTTDVDPPSHKKIKGQKTDPTFNVNEVSGYRPTPGVKIDAHREGDTLWINYFEVPTKGKGMGTQEYLRFEKSLPKDIKKIRLVASDAGYGKTHAFWEMMGFDWAYPDDDNEMIKILEFASGYIPSNAQKNDPRFKTALTKDVRPDSIQKNAKAFGFKTSRAGIPPLLRK